MKIIFRILLSLFIAGMLFGTPSARVEAQATCSITNPYCQWIEQTFWHLCDVHDPYTKEVVGHYWCPYTTGMCSYTYPNGTGCACCFDGGGCYTNCPNTGVTPTAPGGPGGPGNGTSNPTTGPGTATPVPPTPVSYGTISARAVQVSPNDTSCAAIRAVPTTAGEIDGTTIGFTASSTDQPTPGVQSGAQYASFYLVTGSYTLDPVPPNSNWVLARNCWSSSNGTSGEGLSTTLGANETITYDIGYTYGTAWVQTGGGDVYASGTIRSFIPAVTPRIFNANGPVGTCPGSALLGACPGVVTYGTDYDFDALSSNQGSTIVSSKNWLVNATRSTVDYYDLFYHRFNAPTETDNALFGNLISVDKPATRATPYYITGNMTTAPGGWTIDTNDSIIVIVNGDLTIGGPITINGNGFVAFIVKGDITVASSVGEPPNLPVPNVEVEGVYITSPTGTFATGLSTGLNTARLVGKGMFIAGNFLLQRDLEGFGTGNTGSSAELFTYNPKLFFTMPDPMKEMPVTWQEVAP
jgi:hypothetical protein